VSLIPWLFTGKRRLQPNGQVPEDAPATHLKLARLCFFINFDCAIFTEMDVYAAEIESKLQSNHAAGHPSPRFVRTARIYIALVVA